MFKIIFILGAVFAWNSAQAIHCVATVETVDADKQAITSEAPLKIVATDPQTLRLATDIDQAHFFVQGQKQDHSYLMMITLGPDYTRGVTAAMTWDQNHEMRLSRVDGVDVYKLKCRK